MRAGEGCEREFVLRFASERIGLGAVFGEGSHQTAFVVGVFKSIEKHVVDEAGVADAIAGAGTVEEIRGVAHAFHAAGDGDLRAACKQKIVREHDGLHSGAAHFVDGDSASGGGQACRKSGLTRGSLSDAGRENAAEEDFVDCVGGNSGASNSRPIDSASIECGADGGGGELRSGEVFEVALKRADGRAGEADDHNGIWHDGTGVGHSFFLMFRRASLTR